jgi:hypothetical protein
MKTIDFELLEKILLALIAQKESILLSDISIARYDSEAMQEHVRLLHNCDCFNMKPGSAANYLDRVESVNEKGLHLLQVLRRDPERLRDKIDRLRRLEVAFVQAANAVA